MKLREATLRDATALAALHLEARRRAMPYLRDPYTEAETRAWMEEVILPTGGVVLAEADDGRLLGYVSVRLGWLDHLYVAPEAQRLGIGSRLLAAAKAASPSGLRLHVFQRNAVARDFYARHAFDEVERRDGSENEEREPDVVCEWRPATRDLR